MAKHEKISTTYKQIVEYYKQHLHEEDFNVDFADLHNRCWNCGEIAKLYRCHIIPSSAEGEDHPNNYVLLCMQCHKKAPNCDSKMIIWDWLNSNLFYCYDTYNGKEIIDEYQRIYHKDLTKEITNLFKNDESSFYNLLEENILKLKIHLGSGGINTSTWVGMWKNIIDQYKKPLK